jgi:uncharacterized integral membrane protein
MHYQNPKGITMYTRLQTDVWINRIFVVLGAIFVASVITTIVLRFVDLQFPEILYALEAVALGGLVRLFCSPLNREL